MIEGFITFLLGIWWYEGYLQTKSAYRAQREEADLDFDTHYVAFCLGWCGPFVNKLFFKHLEWEDNRAIRKSDG